MTESKSTLGTRPRHRMGTAGMVAVVALMACQARESATKLQGTSSGDSDVAASFPGAPPWRVVRYTLAKGAKVAIELALDASLTSGAQGGAMPTLVFDLELAIDDVAPSGDYKFRSTIVAIHARDRAGTRIPASALEGKLDVLDGVAIVGSLRPDGTMLDPHMDLEGKSIPDALASQLSSLTQSMQHIATPLPRSPIGVGAFWTTRRDVDDNGMKVATSSTVFVRAIDHDVVTLDTTSEMHGADQQIVQQNTTIDVSQLAGSGTGHAVVDISRLAVNGEFASAFHADMKAQGQDELVDMVMNVDISSK